MVRHAAVVVVFIALTVSIGCGGNGRDTESDEQLKTASWEEIVRSARGAEVTWMHWRGDPAINAYVDRYVTKEMQDRYGIHLNAVAGQGPLIFNSLLLEKQAGRERGQVDLVWVNGETFHQLRRANLLFGPFAGRLPNMRYVDTADPVVKYDFEQPTDGFEAPWGRVQFSLIYNAATVPDPPNTIPALKSWIIAHPGRFSYDQSFTGVTFMKTLLYGLSGGVQQFQGRFDSALYARSIQHVWDFLNEIKPYLWKRGETYPADVAQLHALFANGEVDFTMSNNDGEVDNKILQGVLPPSARGVVFDEGTIANTHYQAIPFDAPHKAAAMVLCDFLLSPEAQLQKAMPAVWADGTVLNERALPQEWRERFHAIPGRTAAVPRSVLLHTARPEIRPEYHEHILDDWREHVLKHR